MTLTSKRQHKKDQEKQRKLETRHYEECDGCGEIVSDQEATKIAGYWFHNLECAGRRLEELEAITRKLENKMRGEE